MSHRSLADLPDHELNTELSESKAYLQDVLGRSVADMSIPRGVSSSNVEQAAFDNGFENIGNSRFDLSRKESSTINRLVITAGGNSGYPTRLVGRSDLYWRARKSAKGVKLVLTTHGPHLWPLALLDAFPLPEW